MTHQISGECISCGVCAGSCPSNAISEGDGKYEIESNTCVDCGECVEACPVSAIKKEE